MKISGIYQIQSKCKPERIYIGSAVNIHKRWLNHLVRLHNNIHHSKKLQNHYNKYGKSDLIFSVLISCPVDELLLIEQFFLDSKKPFFNSSPTAGNTYGYKHTKETKEKLKRPRTPRQPMSKEEKARRSEIMRIYWKERGPKSEETRRKISEGHKGLRVALGRKWSEESKSKIKGRTNSLGVPCSEAKKKKLADAMKGQEPWNKGKTGLPSRPKEVKDKISKALKGRPLSEEHRQKIHKWEKGVIPWNKGRTWHKGMKNITEQKQAS